MKRRVVKHGLSTFIISLPADWVKRYGVKRGDELDVEEKGPSVVVHSGKSEKVGNIEVNISDLDRTSIVQLVRTLYKLGYDEITLRFKQQTIPHLRTGQQKTVISVIHEELGRLIGLDVVQQREDVCVLKMLTQMNPDEFQPTLRRAFLQLIDMQRDLTEGAAKHDLPLLETLEEKHNTITKLLNYCDRLLHQHGYDPAEKTSTMQTLVVLIDKLLDTSKNAGRRISGLKKPLSAGGVSTLRDLQKAVEIYYGLHFDFSNAKLMAAAKQQADLLSAFKTRTPKFSPEEAAVLGEALDALEILKALSEQRMALEY